MKLGIITWYKYENYGTVLQAIALQKYLRSKGHHVELLDFSIPSYSHPKSISSMSCYEVTGAILKRIANNIFKKYVRQKSYKFSSCISSNCTISKDEITTTDLFIKSCNSYDMVICGSDQIWNPYWYHPFYFANFEQIMTKRISYAPSFGVTKIPKTQTSHYKTALSRFDSLSVREQSGRLIIESILHRKCPVVMDPTFLIPESDWKALESNDIVPAEKYVLCYMLSDNKNHWRSIRKFAKANRLRMVIIPIGGHSYFQFAKIVKNCGIGDFLALISHADYVITDSYHGSIFSLIYNKQFSTFERHRPDLDSSENSRIYDLLSSIGAENALIKNNSKIINSQKINYKVVNSKIAEKIAFSKKFLDENLK